MSAFIYYHPKNSFQKFAAMAKKNNLVGARDENGIACLIQQEKPRNVNFMAKFFTIPTNKWRNK